MNLTGKYVFYDKIAWVAPPLLRQIFALAPIYARPECGKALRTGTLAMQANNEKKQQQQQQ